MRPGIQVQIGFPSWFGVHVVPGPHGDGLQGSGFSTHLDSLQINPYLQSGSTTHSGPQPVIVSGLGISPGRQVQMGFPSLFGVHVVPGPHGEGLQGSLTLHFISGVGSGTRPSGHLQVGFPSWGIHMEPGPQGLGSQGLGTIQPCWGVGLGTKPVGHLHSGSPSWGIHIEPGPQGLGSQGFLGGSYRGIGLSVGGGGGGGLDPTQVLAHPSKQQSPQFGQSRSDTPTDQQVLNRPRQDVRGRGEDAGQLPPT